MSWITGWDPENERYWATTGRRIAHRNLAFSILAEHLGFSVWLMWSVVAVMLPGVGFAFTADQLFWLVALPNLVGAVLRIPYTAAVARFGGRNWTVVSAALLLVPLALLWVCVTDPSTPYWMFLVSAGTAGLGGGVFASAMANISYFYPERYKGFALGVTAAGGNVGVAVVQLVAPAIVIVGVGVHVQNVTLLYLAPVLLATLCAWLFMDNLSAVRADLAAQLSALRYRHTWVISFLYIGTFGSFIGYSAAFPLLIKTQFAGTGAYLAFLGPLVGSLSRPVGGWLADRVGGARVTAAVFLAMSGGVCGVLIAVNANTFPLFLLSFLFLFVVSGIGNGSTYRMIPAIFRTEALLAAAGGADRDRALALGRTRAAAVIGLAGAIGALGGFLIPRGFGISIANTGSITAALMIFLAGYAVCLAATWWWYLRPAFAIAV